MITDSFRRMASSLTFHEDNELLVSMMVVLAFNPLRSFTPEQLCAHLGGSSSLLHRLKISLNQLKHSWAGGYFNLREGRISVRRQMHPSLLGRLTNMAGHHGTGFDKRLFRIIPEAPTLAGAPEDPIYQDADNSVSRPFFATDLVDEGAYTLRVYTFPIHLVLITVLLGNDATEDAIDAIPIRRLLAEYQTQLSVLHRYGDYYSLIVTPYITNDLVSKGRVFAASVLSSSEYSVLLRTNVCASSDPVRPAGPTVSQWSQLLSDGGPRIRALFHILEQAERL